MLKPGWLKRQLEQSSDDVRSWPEWMRRAAGVTDEARDLLVQICSPPSCLHTMPSENPNG